MKKWVCFALILVCILSMGGCAKEPKAVTCEEVVAAYEAAGYTPFHKHPAEGYDYDCYITVEDEERDEQIFFHFFSTVEAAESYAETRQYNVLLWLFSAIYGKPSWLNTEAYQNIEIEYIGSAIYKSFDKLIG